MEHERSGPSTVEQLFRSQFLIVTGKGGVGKTTLSASLARLAAEKGKRVLVVEMGPWADAPSPIHAALTGRTSPGSVEPVLVEPNLHRITITPQSGHRAFLRDMMRFRFLADRALKTDAVSGFLQAAPALAGLGALYRVMQFLEKKRRNGEYEHELVIVDAPATGHVLGFATLPEVVARLIPVGPIARACRDGLTILRDPQRSAVVLVTLPETLPVSESLELKAGLDKSRVKIGATILNQIPYNPFSKEEQQALSNLLDKESDRSVLLGERSLGRLQRSEAAASRLEAGVGMKLIKIREHSDRGPLLIAHIATELAAS